MDFIKLLKKHESNISEAVGKVRMVFSLFANLIIIFVLLCIIVRFNLVQIVMDTDSELYAKILLTGMFAIFFVSAIAGILDAIAGLLSYSEGLVSERVRLLIFIKTILSSAAIMAVGFIFIFFGIYTARELFSSGILVMSMGVFPLMAGILELVKNYIFYKDYDSQFDERPTVRYVVASIVNDHIQKFIFGLIFVLVLPMMIEMSIVAPGMGYSVKLTVIGMGVLFAVIGIFVIVSTVKKVKEEVKLISVTSASEK